MPAFAYTARDSNGAAASGTLVAESITQATQQLRAEGKYPTSVRPASDPAAGRATVAVGGRGIKISRKEVVQFSTQLGVMVETGVTLSEALVCIATQSEKPQ